MMKQFYSAIVIVLLFMTSINGDLYDLPEEPDSYTSMPTYTPASYSHHKHKHHRHRSSSYTPTEPAYIPYDHQKPTTYVPKEQTSYAPEEAASYAPEEPTSYSPEEPTSYTPTKPTTSYAPVNKNGIEYEFLAPQNAARAAVGLPPLVWDSTLADYAQSWANERRTDCALEHSHGNYGENIFWGSDSAFTASKAASEWVAEQSNYNYEDNSCSGEMCGHYTQIVWKTTTKVGCAQVDCYSGQGVFMVCSYDPAGNVIGEKPY